MSQPDPLDCNPNPDLPAAVDLQTLLGVLGYDAAKVPPRQQREEVDNAMDMQNCVDVLDILKGPEVDHNDLGEVLNLVKMDGEYEQYALLKNMTPSPQEALNIHYSNEGSRFRHRLAQASPVNFKIPCQDIALATFHYRLAQFTKSEYPEVFDTREVPEEVSRMHREGAAYIRQEFVLKHMEGFDGRDGGNIDPPYRENGFDDSSNWHPFD